MLRSVLVVLLALATACAGPDESDLTHEAIPGHDEGVRAASQAGEVNFAVSCAPEVTEDFDEALALMHHMMYQDAQAAFEGIIDRDPECAMARWGAAMTLFQPLWPARPDREVRDRGLQLASEARELGPGSEREEALIEAALAFFEEPEQDEWWPRIRRWSDAMENAWAAHADDPDVGALYGLSLLAAGQTSDDQLGWNARAAGVLAEIHEEHPRHPGAIHYIIHADDAAGRASEHLRIVDSYSEIAPRVPHALHMPSHIHVRLGDWPEVIDWNRRSADAALEHPAGDRISLHHVHALDYMLYGYLQQGADAAARQLLDEALSASPYQEDFITAFHLAIMPARFVVERRAWSEAAVIEAGEPDYLAWERYTWPRAITSFARGLGAVHTGAVADAREAEARLIAIRDEARAADESAFATYIEIDRLILSARLALAEGEIEEAIGLGREAADLEQTVQKHPVTPGALLPPWEALGEILSEAGRHEAAVEAFTSGLAVWPGRYHSLLGAARAARAAGDKDAASGFYRDLMETVDTDRSEREGVAEAGAFLAGR